MRMMEEMGVEARRQAEHYAAVRGRLIGVKPAVERPVAIVAPLISVPMLDEPRTAPFDMLGPCSWRFILAYVALKHGVNPADILGRSRDRQTCLARHEAVYMITLHTEFSIVRIGRFFGRHHTSALNSLKMFPRIKRANDRTGWITAAVAQTHISAMGMSSSEVVRIVQQAYARGESTAVTAERIGLSQPAVKQIALRANLTHALKPYIVRSSTFDKRAYDNEYNRTKRSERSA